MKQRNVILLVGLVMLVGCKHPSVTDQMADKVVYGTIYTADSTDAVVSAIAIKDGRYIYVGDREGVTPYIGEKTEVTDYSKDGLITPGFTEGHAHYISDQMVKASLSLFDLNDKAALSKRIKDYVDANPDKKAICGMGWNLQVYGESLTREWLDSLCPTIPLYLKDTEGHKGIANTACLRRAFAEGQMYVWNIDEPMSEETAQTIIPGGVVGIYPKGHKDEGKVSGFLSESAGTYVRQKGLGATFTDAEYIDLCRKTVQHLNELGFTNYVDGWLNQEDVEAPFKAFKTLDESGGLNAYVTGCYEIEGWNKNCRDEVLGLTQLRSKYSTRRFKVNHIKLFMDGTTEGMTANNIIPYKNGDKGVVVWDQESLNLIAEYATENDIICHWHSYGDGAVKMAVEALDKAGKATGKHLRHTLVHVRNIRPEDVQTCALNGFTIAGGLNWHALPDGGDAFMRNYLDDYYVDNMYPMKSIMAAGINLTGASDAPATSGFPGDPYGIMAIAVTCSYNGSQPVDVKEALSRTEALRVFTINGAKQVGIESERGSIEVGKYADFAVADGNILTCDKDVIKDIKVVHTYFEGNLVY